MKLSIPIRILVTNTDCLRRDNNEEVAGLLQATDLPDIVGLLEVLNPSPASKQATGSQYDDLGFYRQQLAESYGTIVCAEQWYAKHQELGPHRRDFGGEVRQVMLATARRDLRITSCNARITNPRATDFTFPGEIDQHDHARPIIELTVDFSNRVIANLRERLARPIDLKGSFAQAIRANAKVHYILVHGPHSKGRRGNQRTLEYFSKVLAACQDSTEVPTVIVGDFNATPDFHPLFELLETRFENATVAHGITRSTACQADQNGVDVENTGQLVDYLLTSRGNVKTRKLSMLKTGGDHLAISAETLVTFELPEIPAEYLL